MTGRFARAGAMLLLMGATLAGAQPPATPEQAMSRPVPASTSCPSGPAEPRPAMARPPGPARVDPNAGKPRILFIADTHTGNQNAHDGLSHAMGQLENAARKAGMLLYLRTDTEWVTKDEVWGTGDYAKGCKRQARGRNLNDFAAIVFYTNGETDMTPAQKADLLDWVKSGKGFVGIHTATATGARWPEYGEMIGGYFDNHPWNVVDAKVIVERPDFPGMQAYVQQPMVTDEHYQMMAPYDRSKVDVLARLDTSGLDMTNPNVHRKDGDFPIAWIKDYGKGRVFYSHLGHPDAAWEDPRMLGLFVNAIRWASGQIDYPARPHPLPQR